MPPVNIISQPDLSFFVSLGDTSPCSSRAPSESTASANTACPTFLVQALAVAFSWVLVKAPGDSSLGFLHLRDLDVLDLIQRTTPHGSDMNQSRNQKILIELGH